MPADRRTECPLPRGDVLLLAMALKHAARRHGHDLQRLTAAVVWAAQVHRRQQRSADGAPYLVHPLLVATLVCEWGGSAQDVLAAVLHDTAEDSADGPRAALNHIADVFGKLVSLRVSALTKHRGIPSDQGRWLDQSQRLDDAIAHLGKGVAAIRLADRLHNTVTAAHLPLHRQQRLRQQNQSCLQALARRLGAHGVAGFLAAGPAQWWPDGSAGDAFVPRMLALQPPWLQPGARIGLCGSMLASARQPAAQAEHAP